MSLLESERTYTNAREDMERALRDAENRHQQELRKQDNLHKASVASLEVRCELAEENESRLRMGLDKEQQEMQRQLMRMKKDLQVAQISNAAYTRQLNDERETAQRTLLEVQRKAELDKRALEEAKRDEVKQASEHLVRMKQIQKEALAAGDSKTARQLLFFESLKPRDGGSARADGRQPLSWRAPGDKLDVGTLASTLARGNPGHKLSAWKTRAGERASSRPSSSSGVRPAR